MAEFCKQCSIDTFGADYGDFAGLITQNESDRGLVAIVLCEGCGEMIYVDHEGSRVKVKGN